MRKKINELWQEYCANMITAFELAYELERLSEPTQLRLF